MLLYYYIGGIVATYLLGSLSSAIIVAKIWGLPDPRSRGSNNPGATNILRLGGKLPAIFTLLGDGCKGFIPTLLVTQMHWPAWVVGSVMLAALIGHIWPIFFGFRGGKGVATAMGAYLGLSWLVGGSLILIWAAVIFISRISSLGAIVATLLTPLIAWLVLQDVTLTVFMSMMSIILLYRHQANISRLCKGVEKKI